MTNTPNTDTDIDEILHTIYLGDDEHDKKVYLDETYTGYKEAKAAIVKKLDEARIHELQSAQTLWSAGETKQYMLDRVRALQATKEGK